MSRKIPLASMLRPTTLDEIVGQEHLLSSDSTFRKMIESGYIDSIIFYGRPGTGKTTIAEIISGLVNYKFVKLNATSLSVSDIRKAAKQDESVVLCIDECYRLSKNQQDVLLPLIESGSIIFIGCTTESPFHSMIGAVVSRSQIFQLEPLTQSNLLKLIIKVIKHYNSNNKSIKVDAEAAKHLSLVSCGDGRKVISLLELCAIIADDGHITVEVAEAVAPSKYYIYSQDEHFSLASAFQGSIQASDPDSAVYWLAKWLESGEDPRYIARRLLVSAAEDAFSNPICTAVAHAAYVAACEVGRPECDIVLSQATILIAQSERDKTAANAIWGAVKDVRNGLDISVPKEMRDSHYPGSSVLGHGQYADGCNQSAYVGVNKKYIK